MAQTLMIIRSKPQFTVPKQEQRGATLVVSLILLIVMAMIGLSSMQSTTFEEKMAGNMRDQSVAFQAAETALRAGEIYLGTPILPVFNGSDGLYQPASGSTDLPVWETIDWSDASNVVTVSNLTIADAINNPVYIIEELADVVDSSGSLEAALPKVSAYYRVTARGSGTTATSQVILQSVFKR
ncbi:MAG TPA: pilus assembly protein PilX [Crenotrichaceae bacterium]|nr:pilus assembly protein PilX [Crenotrichaceae bacterium]